MRKGGWSIRGISKSWDGGEVREEAVLMPTSFFFFVCLVVIIKPENPYVARAGEK